MQARIRASLVHLAITAAVVIAASLVVTLLWYPPPYFRILGAGRILALVALGAVVIGPVLTFVVFKPGKKGLLFDLVVIVLAQALALGFGMRVLYQERPWFMVYAVDRFNVLARRDVEAEVPDGWRLAKPLSGPVRLIARMPADPDERGRLLEETLFQGMPDLERRPEYWSDWEAGFPGVMARSTTLAALRQARPEAARAIERLLGRSGRAAVDLVFIPVVGKRRDFAVVLARDNGKIMGVVAVDPWLE